MEAVAKLNNYPTGPRKMRLIADVIRGMEVEKALAILEFHPQHNAVPLAKFKSAISNWEQKNNGASAEALCKKLNQINSLAGSSKCLHTVEPDQMLCVFNCLAGWAPSNLSC